MTDQHRLVLQGRAQIVLLVLILAVLVRGSSSEMDSEAMAWVVGSATAVIYALKSIIPRDEG